MGLVGLLVIVIVSMGVIFHAFGKLEDEKKRGKEKMNELFIMFLIYVVSILLTAVIWFSTTKKDEIGDIHFLVGLLLTGPVALCVTIWEMFSIHNARVRGDFE